MKSRMLTPEEGHLLRWMIEHGSPEGKAFLPQIDLTRVTPWRCGCGCASIHFEVGGAVAPPGVQIIADFFFGDEDNLSGIFLFEKEGTLSGLEVYGLSGGAPKTLPAPDDLRPAGFTQIRN